MYGAPLYMYYLLRNENIDTGIFLGRGPRAFQIGKICMVNH